jgi:hypothetical protein
MRIARLSLIEVNDKNALCCADLHRVSRSRILGNHRVSFLRKIHAHLALRGYLKTSASLGLIIECNSSMQASQRAAAIVVNTQEKSPVPQWYLEQVWDEIVEAEEQPSQAEQ